MSSKLHKKDFGLDVHAAMESQNFLNPLVNSTSTDGGNVSDNSSDFSYGDVFSDVSDINESDFTVDFETEAEIRFRENYNTIMNTVNELAERYENVDSDWSETASNITGVDDSAQDDFREGQDSNVLLDDLTSDEQQDYVLLLSYMSQSAQILTDHEIGLSRLFREPWTFYVPLCRNVWGHREKFQGCQSIWCKWVRDSYELKGFQFVEFHQEYQSFLDSEPLMGDIAFKSSPELYSLVQNPDYHEQFATMNYRILTRGWYNNLQSFFCMVKSARIVSSRVANMAVYAGFNRKIFDCVLHHPYSKGLRPAEDQFLMLNLFALGVNPVQRKQFFSDLYMIRQLMDDSTDYGFKDWSERNVAEGNVFTHFIRSVVDKVDEVVNPNDVNVMPSIPEEEPLELPLGPQRPRVEELGMADYLVGKIYKFVTRAPRADQMYWNVHEWISQKLDVVFNMFIDMLVIVKDVLIAPFKAIKDIIIKMLTGTLKDTLNKLVESAELKKILIGSLISLVAVSLAVAGIISKSMTDGIVRGLNQMSEKVVGQVAESGDDVVGFFKLLFVGFFDMEYVKYAKIEKIIKNMLILLSGGAIIANTYGTILTMLPHTLRMALIMKFGTKET
jgi:hypothetical protein